MITKETPEKEILKLVHDCSCDACKNPCNYGSGTLIDSDVKRIAKFLNITVEELKEQYLEEYERFNKNLLRPKILRKDLPHGKCIFFDDGCKVHDVKPMECKLSMGCKNYGEELLAWFNLNYIVDKDDPQSLREYAIYTLSGGKVIPGGDMRDLVPDPKRLKQILNYEILGHEKDWAEELGIKDLLEDGNK